MAAVVTTGQELIDEFVRAGHGDLGKVRELLARESSLINARASWDETALGAAAHVGQVEIARFLLSVGAPLDICTAAMLGLETRVATFLATDPGQAHANGAHGLPVLFYPAIRSQIAVAGLLLAHGADINAVGGAPLHGAVGFNQPLMVEWLLQHGATVDAPREGKTPLAIALAQGSDAIVDVLRQYGGKA